MSLVRSLRAQDAGVVVIDNIKIHACAQSARRCRVVIMRDYVISDIGCEAFNMLRRRVRGIGCRLLLDTQYR